MTRNERGFIGFICFMGILVAIMVAEGVYLWASKTPKHVEKVNRVREEPTYVEKVFRSNTFRYRVVVDTVEVDGHMYVVAVSSTGLSIIPSASCNCIER